MMQTLSNAIRAYGLNALWQMPLLVLAAECMARLLKPARAVVVHRVWVACLLLAVALPAAPFLRLTQTQTAAQRPRPVAMQIESADRDEAPGSSARLNPATADRPERNLAGKASVARPPAVHNRIAEIVTVMVRPLLGLYLLSIVFALARFAWGLWRTAALLSQAQRDAHSDEMQALWMDCCQAFALRDVSLLRSDRLASPATLTFPRPVVLLPLTLGELDQPELAAAFCHELAHVSRRDFPKNLLYEIVAAPLFFHPATHWIRRRIQQTRELACDDMAATVLHSRERYASSLVRLANTVSNAASATLGRALGVLEGDAMEERIMNLLDTKPAQPRWRVAVSVACGVALLAGSCVVTARFGLRPVLAANMPNALPGDLPSTAVPIPVAASAQTLHAIAAALNSAADDLPVRKPATSAPEPVSGVASVEAPAPSPAPVPEPVQDGITYHGAPPQLPDPGDLKPVAFTLTKTRFEPGDAIVIDELRGTSDTVTQGGLYQIKGHYTLASQASALLAASVTTSSPHPVDSPSLNMSVAKGEGHFSLWLWIREKGEPHLSFYPTAGGESFATVYFATAATGASSAAAAPTTSAGRTSGVPKGWLLAGSKPEFYRSGIDKANLHEGQSSAFLVATASSTGGFGTLSQYFKASDYLGKRVRLRAWVRAKDVSSWAGLWMRVDQEEKSVAFDNMQDRAIKGTADWKLYDVVLDVPKTATDIAMGILLDGPGQVWISGVKVEVVGNDVASTDLKTGKSTPAGPVNLAFDK